MPTAIQNCQGSLRLVPVNRFRPDDKAECSSCNAKPKAKRRIENAGRDLYYEIPPHRADGQKDGSQIDWGNVK